MSDYKLVPVEPTPEMVSAAEDAYMPFGDMGMAIRMAILAASAVQAEPELCQECGGDGAGGEHEDDCAMAQPAEQQPAADGSLTPVPDELFAAEFNEWWEQHGQFCRAGGGDYERTFAFEAWRHLYPKLMKLQKAAAEQQPVPDVAALVESLETIRKAATHESIHTGIQAGTALGYIAAICDIALAAHRGQGGDV